MILIIGKCIGTWCESVGGDYGYMDQGCSVTKIDEHRVARFGGSEMLRYDVSIFDIDTLVSLELEEGEGGRGSGEEGEG